MISKNQRGEKVDVGPKVKNFWTLAADGSLEPQPDMTEAAWQAWMTAHKHRIGFKVSLGKHYTLGIRFAGLELGLNSRGEPLLWQIVLFHHGEVVMHGKLASLPMLDWTLRHGQVYKWLTQAKIGRIAQVRLWLRYGRWRKRLGGSWPGWKTILNPVDPRLR
jgi:hypothetical protein